MPDIDDPSDFTMNPGPSHKLATITASFILFRRKSASFVTS